MRYANGIYPMCNIVFHIKCYLPDSGGNAIHQATYFVYQ